MHRAIVPLALACATLAALPAAASTVSVTARTRGPAVEVYIEAQSRGVTPTYLYDYSKRERRVLARTAPPPVGSFAYFGVGGATAVAVVTHVHPDGTVTLLHHDPYGAAIELRMNLRHPKAHKRGGRVVNDYVLFTGKRSLAPAAFYGYAQPPPRVVVINAPHSGHRGAVGPRDPHQRVTCHEPGHPGRGNAWGKCKNGGNKPRVIHTRGHKRHDHAHGKHDPKKNKKKTKTSNKKDKRDKKDDGKRGDKRQERDRDHDKRARKRISI